MKKLIKLISISTYIFLLINNLLFGQYSEDNLWVIINNEENKAYNGLYTRNMDLNSILQEYYVSKFEQAFPFSKKRLSCECLFDRN